MISVQSSAYSEMIPYVWSLVLSAGTVILTIPPLYIARFKAKFELADLSSFRAMFDPYPEWGKLGSSKLF